MSISTEISRIQTNRNTIRAKLVELGMATNIDNLDVLASAIEGIVNRGAVSVTVQEGDTYTIPAGYHNGSGTVSGVAGGGNYNLQSKTATPTKKQQNVTPDSGYYGLSDVTVAPIPDAYQDVTSVTATAGDVLTGKIYVTKDGVVTTGTMANNGSVSKTLNVTTVSYTIPKGYHSGSGKVTITLETKSVTPTKSQQKVTPTSGKVLSEVTVEPIPAAYQDVTEVDATASDVLDGKKIVTADGTVTEGTMPNNGARNAALTPSTATFNIPAGYHNGSGFVYVAASSAVATPTKEVQTIKGNNAYLSSVQVDPIPAAYQDVTSVTAESADVLTGKTIVDADGTVIAGSMAIHNDSPQAKLDQSNPIYYISEGYHDGNGRVSVDAIDKTFTPTKSAQTYQVTASTKSYLRKVTVAAIPDAYQDVTKVDAVAAEVLDGKKIVAADGAVVTGAMPNNGDVSETIDGLTATSVSVPAGYTSGGTVSLTSDIEEALAAI